MSTFTIVMIVIIVVLLAACIALYFFGKKAQKKQAEQQEQMEAAAQTVSMLIIDKKKMKLKEAGLPADVRKQSIRGHSGKERSKSRSQRSLHNRDQKRQRRFH